MLAQDDLLTQKIELILDMNGKKVLSELSKIREEISSLRAEVDGLKKAQRFGSGAAEAPKQAPWQNQQPEPAWQNAPPQQAPPQQWQQAPPQQQQWQQAPSSSAQQAAPSHPYALAKEREAQAAAAEPPRRHDQPIDRNNVAPAQVSIEKMFYFGNKK